MVLWGDFKATAKTHAPRQLPRYPGVQGSGRRIFMPQTPGHAKNTIKHFLLGRKCVFFNSTFTSFWYFDTISRGFQQIRWAYKQRMWLQKTKTAILSRVQRVFDHHTQPNWMTFGTPGFREWIALIRV
jgi:hypothetical protein